MGRGHSCRSSRGCRFLHSLVLYNAVQKSGESFHYSQVLLQRGLTWAEKTGVRKRITASGIVSMSKNVSECITVDLTSSAGVENELVSV